MMYGMLLVAILLVMLMSHDIWRQLAVRLSWRLAPPCAVGDVVQIDDHCGAVEKIGWLNLHIRVQEGSLLVLPNRYVQSRALIRMDSPQGANSAHMLLPVPTGMDPSLARAHVRNAVQVSPYLAPDMPIHVVLETDTDGRMRIRVRASVLDSELRDPFVNSVIEGFAELTRPCPTELG